MKIKYLAYTLLIIGFGAFIAYRISENKKKDDSGKYKCGKNKMMTVSGVVVKLQTLDNNLSLSWSI